MTVELKMVCFQGAYSWENSAIVGLVALVYEVTDDDLNLCQWYAVS